MHRKPRTPFEASTRWLAKIREAAEAAQREAAEGARAQAVASAPDGARPQKSRGRPHEPGSRRDVARRTKISPRQQLRIERHVALGHEYPFSSEARWNMADALKTGFLLQGLTPGQRSELLPSLTELDPPTALRRLEALAGKRPGVAPDGQARVPAPQSAAHKTALPPATTAVPRRDGPPLSVADALHRASRYMMYAAKRVAHAPLNEKLRRIAGTIDQIRLRLRPRAGGDARPRS